MTHAKRSALLIHFTGPDGRGITADVSGILASHNVGILDIGQAVVHENLALGILVEFPAGATSTALSSALKACAQAHGLEVRFTPDVLESLPRWLHGLHGSYFIITMLGKGITPKQIARVSSIITSHGMNVDRIDRLSERLSSHEDEFNACIEFAVRGDAAEEPAMRADFLEAAKDLGIDIAFQRESIFRRNRRLFAFDMDSTLIQGEVIDELARMAGVGEKVAKITEAAMRGELNFDESFTCRVGLLKGLPAERALALLESIPLADGAERLIRTLKLLGYKTAILSGGFTFFAHHLQRLLGIDYIHSNELEIVSGKVTGRVIPPIINGARKAELLGDLARRECISLEQVVAVGDGANDIPMLNLAGMGIAYRAKPLVRQKADHSISYLGLDGLLYLLGVRDRDLLAHERSRGRSDGDRHA
ncbi:MAG TPA: phosphoserine phosphatase SerB [Terracidiphilus sp.]|jgi:phosphoserine phosphatase|nr:phosphoserine phosphatase SerB [Terracidiphilus sp.]